MRHARTLALSSTIALLLVSCSRKPTLEVDAHDPTPKDSTISLSVKTASGAHVRVSTRHTAKQASEKEAVRKLEPIFDGEADGDGKLQIAIPVADLVPVTEGVDLAVWSQKKPFAATPDKNLASKTVHVRVPLRFEAKKDPKGTFEIPGLDCTLFVGGSKDATPGMEVELIGFKCPSASFTVGGKALQAKPGKNPTGHMACDDLVDFKTIDMAHDFVSKVHLGVDVGGLAGELDLDFDAEDCAGSVLAKRIAAGLRLPGEKDPGGKGAAILLRPFRAKEFDLLLLGTAKTFDDVDRVALETTKERAFGCRYTGGNSASRFEVDSTVVVYDRRTGRELARRSFTAPPGRCAGTMKVDTKYNARTTEGGAMYSRAPASAIGEWVSTVPR